MSSKIKDRLALVQRRKWKAVQETHKHFGVLGSIAGPLVAQFAKR